MNDPPTIAILQNSCHEIAHRQKVLCSIRRVILRSTFWYCFGMLQTMVCQITPRASLPPPDQIRVNNHMDPGIGNVLSTVSALITEFFAIPAASRCTVRSCRAANARLRIALNSFLSPLFSWHFWINRRSLSSSFTALLTRSLWNSCSSLPIITSPGLPPHLILVGHNGIDFGLDHPFGLLVGGGEVVE